MNIRTPAIALSLLLGTPFASAAAKKAPVKKADAKSGVPDQLRWSEDWGPMVPHKKFPRDCGLCHVPKRWDVLRPDFHFDHKKETGYALDGAHAAASCLRCHNDRGPVAVYKARGCAGCHPDPHKSAMGMDCKRCHLQTSWQLRGAQGERIADHARTRFPLSGMHATLSCDQCHNRASAGDFRGASRDCYQCHRDEYLRCPKHTTAGFPHDCSSCHTPVAWAGAVFNHAAFSASGNCSSCHMSDYQRAPNHVAQNLPQTCGSCHSQTTWLGATFAHAPGSTNCMNCHHASSTHRSHQNATCVRCHPGSYTKSTWACQSCHNHSAGELAKPCK